MRIVVIGGSGLVGAQVVGKLARRGHDVVAASPSLGIDALTGEGLADALKGADVVVDVSNSPTLEAEAALAFFRTSNRNLLAVAAAAGVRHHLALSITGTKRLQESGYFRAKQAQEELIRASGLPYTILHATQFFEFVNGIVETGADGDVIRVPPAYVQPIASADVATALSEIAGERPAQGIVEVAGPERHRLHELAVMILTANEDMRQVIPDIHARYFGAELGERSLLSGDRPRLASTRFEDWLCRSMLEEEVLSASTSRPALRRSLAHGTDL